MIKRQLNMEVVPILIDVAPVAPVAPEILLGAEIPLGSEISISADFNELYTKLYEIYTKYVEYIKNVFKYKRSNSPAYTHLQALVPVIVLTQHEKIKFLTIWKYCRSFEKILTNYHKDGNKDAFILGLQESLKILLEINTAFILINLHDSV